VAFDELADLGRRARPHSIGDRREALRHAVIGGEAEGNLRGQHEAGHVELTHFLVMDG